MNFIKVALIVVVMLLTGCQKQAMYHGPIIDVHMHAFSYDRYGQPAPANPVTQVVPSAKSDLDVMNKTLQMMQKLKITKAVISGPLEDVTLWKSHNDSAFIGGLYYHPRTPLLDMPAVEQAVEKGIIGVFGELGLAYGGLNPSDPSVAAYLKYAEVNKIPVGIHMALGEPNLALNWAPKFRIKLVNPLVIEELVLKYPKLKIYLMHAGWPFLQETKAIMCMFDNVYADLSVINWILPDAEFQSYLKNLMNMSGLECDLSKKLMYGSDQMIWTDAIELSINNIQKIPFISVQQKADIFYKNAFRFFELGDE
ncbi:amidohydrolase family protein [Marinicella sp. W31]|uniref:amidohydrolase family protein n=1 Tax=Marinicella sp. W31 TaxID=3023713 RepID=UPI003757E8CE